jgi:hypothetical protein
VTEFENHRDGNSAAQQKLALAHLFQQSSSTSIGLARNGVISGLTVSQTASASGSVVIDQGSCVVQTSVLSGASQLVSDTDKTLDVLTANPVGSLARNDLIVFDRTGGSSGGPAIRAIVGTPNASPSDPSVPSGAFRLARLRHAAFATTVPTAKIDDLRVFTAVRGTPVPVASRAARDALVTYEGLQVYRLDTKDIQIYASSSWSMNWFNLPLANPTPYEIYDSGSALQYCRINGIVYMQGAINRIDGADITSPGNRLTIGTLPAGYRPFNRQKFMVDASFVSTNVGGHLWISNAGVITFDSSGAGAKWFAISNVIFPAADY